MGKLKGGLRLRDAIKRLVYRQMNEWIEEETMISIQQSDRE